MNDRPRAPFQRRRNFCLVAVLFTGIAFVVLPKNPDFGTWGETVVACLLAGLVLACVAFLPLLLLEQVVRKNTRDLWVAQAVMAVIELLVTAFSLWLFFRP
ncbi:MAG: hypothetical protein SFY92_06630 [Verrucomicrobiae bacterium]|nr:hypothetical protein [Verrucomicrobiae bacterium]